MARVTGIGGVFFKTADPAATRQWYADHLGIALEPWGGAVLKWPDDASNDGGVTVWQVAATDSEWFDGPFMVNYRVNNLDEMLSQLRAAEIEIVGGPESHENGKFAWIRDLDGRKVELWQAMLWDDANKAAGS